MDMTARFARDAEKAERRQNKPPRSDVRILGDHSVIRHVLVIRENGDYGTEHVEGTAELYDMLYCARLHEALKAFRQHIARTPREYYDYEMSPLRPGRYWMDVDDDGNLAVGGPVPDSVVTS